MRARVLRRTAAVLAVLAIVLGIGVQTTAPVAALTSGTKSNEPWVVQVYDTLAGIQTTTCTGTAIADDWVLTADHCPASHVYYRYAPSPSEDEVTEAVPVAESISLAPADMKLLRLSRPHALPRYPRLVPDGYRVGSVGHVYGLGPDLFPTQRTEKVWIRRVGRMPNGVIGFHSTATTGGTEQLGETGDSGGPLIVNGNLVGVFYGTTLPGERVQMMGYTDVRPAAAKLKQLQGHDRSPREAASDATAGITDVSVVRGYAEVTMSEALVHSGKRIVVWIDGRYAGDYNEGRGWYAWKYDVPGGTKIVPTTPVKDGDLVQVGELASGVDVAAADLLFQKSLTGVDSIQRTGDRIAVAMSRALVNSGKRVVIWVDGVYRAEVLDDVSLYASKTNIDGASIVTPDGTVPEDALVQIGVLPAGTDIDQAEILDSRIL
ncbi:trypsin-like serine protease [Rathayibacter sp. VKM Ac-2857]|uniref:trypsin-like serine protease n=1 Tax=Rathayibacter sp. VKM Ac-2857 TaxID=2739020 RepID=UPI001565BF10|nr:trypsin-like serine protease [Rathayibacter sp. VKM Ac-2857]NQX14640.1 trypsin-like serine protease [Rathayibacter sp. VKM Ac-2857]